jgi:hypothetical protein
MEVAAGFQDGDEDSQEQVLAAGIEPVVATRADGSALAVSGRSRSQTQTNDCGTQSQYVSASSTLRQHRRAPRVVTQPLQSSPTRARKAGKMR